MSEELSIKIRMATFICTLMVVYRHSLNYLAFFDSWTGTGISGRVEGGMAVFTEIAIPYFFIISGYFFFRKDYYVIANYKKMILVKTRTLLVPYLIWNVVGVFALWFTNRDQVGDSFFSCFYHLGMSDWYGPLWYVRDLMVLMVFAPIMYWLFRINHWLLYLVVFIPLFIFWKPVDISFISSEGILFFILGGFLQQQQKIILLSLPKLVVLLFAFIWIAASFSGITHSNIYIHKLNTIIGLVAFWQFIDIIKSSIESKILFLCQFSFLIYVLHFNIQKVLKTILGVAFHGSDIAALLTYLLLPIGVVVIIVYIGQFLKKHCPVFLSLATGGR